MKTQMAKIVRDYLIFAIRQYYNRHEIKIYIIGGFVRNLIQLIEKYPLMKAVEMAFEDLNDLDIVSCDIFTDNHFVVKLSTFFSKKGIPITVTNTSNLVDKPESSYLLSSICVKYKLTYHAFYGKVELDLDIIEKLPKYPDHLLSCCNFDLFENKLSYKLCSCLKCQGVLAKNIFSDDKAIGFLDGVIKLNSEKKFVLLTSCQNYPETHLDIFFLLKRVMKFVKKGWNVDFKLLNNYLRDHNIVKWTFPKDSCSSDACPICTDFCNICREKTSHDDLLLRYNCECNPNLGSITCSNCMELLLRENRKMFKCPICRTDFDRYTIDDRQ